MKKLLYLGIVLMFASCNNNNHCGNGVQDGDETGVDCGGSCVALCPPPTPTPSGPGGYWMFDLTINGVNHKAEGYQSDNPNYYGVGGSGSHNHCISYNSSSGNNLYMGIADQSASSYISGDNGTLTMVISNPSVGVCDAQIMNSQTSFFPTNGFAYCHPYYGYTLTATDTNTLIGLTTLPLNITDLGTATSMDILQGTGNYGAPFMGNCSGTIYLCSSVDGVVYHYDFPVTIDLDFIAQRYPQ